MRRLHWIRSLLRVIAALVFSVFLTAGTACNAPPVSDGFIPIPPPDPTFGAPTPEIDGDGVAHTYWKVTSPPSARLSEVYVYITNIDFGRGAIVQAAQDGSYETRIEGRQDDWILFGFGAPNGETQCWLLREGLAVVSCE